MATVPLVIRTCGNQASLTASVLGRRNCAQYASQDSFQNSGGRRGRLAEKLKGAFHHVQARMLHRHRECWMHQVPSTTWKRAYNSTLLVSLKRVVLRGYEYCLDQYLLIADSWLSSHGSSSEWHQEQYPQSKHLTVWPRLMSFANELTASKQSSKQAHPAYRWPFARLRVSRQAWPKMVDHGDVVCLWRQDIDIPC